MPPISQELQISKELILEGCVNLVKVHPSFGMLKKLVVLNMRDCKRFRRFPCKVVMDSLEVVNLLGCSKLDKLPEFLGTIRTLREFSVDGSAIVELPSFVFSQCNLQVLEFGRREEKRSRWWTSISQPSWLPSKMQHPQSLIMPSLADLCFLREINFSHCNILEVSDSIGGLSCLESLDLEGNNFTSLPAGCLSQLSRLRALYFSGCKKLEVLPELPPNLEYLNTDHCTSLHEVEGPLTYNNIHSSLGMYLSGCPKLFRNVSIESEVCVSQPQPHPNSSITSHTFRNQMSSFFKYIKAPSNTSEIFPEQEIYGGWFNLIYHGNRIPQWFTNQSMGNRVKVELPPDWCFSKFRGYGICVVFTPKKSYRGKSYYVTPSYYVDNFDGTSLVERYHFCYDCIGIPKSDIIWFHYTTFGIQALKKAKNFVTFSFGDTNDVEVKECGVRLVFDQHIQGEGEETNLSITQDLPTPTQDGGFIDVWRNGRFTRWTW